MKGKLRRLSCKYVMKQEELKFSERPTSRPTDFQCKQDPWWVLDEHKTVMKKFFKETACTAVLRSIFLGVDEQETGPDWSSQGLLFWSNSFRPQFFLLNSHFSWSFLWVVWLGLQEWQVIVLFAFALWNESKHSSLLEQIFAAAKTYFYNDLRLDEPRSSTRFLSALMFSCLRDRVVQDTILSLLNRVPCVPFNLLVPSCPKFRRALVPSMLACPRARVPKFSACPRAIDVGVPLYPRALIFGVPSCLPCWRALVPACPNYRRALVPSMLACPRARIFGVPSCLRAQIFGVPSCLCCFKTMDNIWHELDDFLFILTTAPRTIHFKCSQFSIFFCDD